MIEIDGSFGEGGGQIVRTSLSMSCLYALPFRIRKIRENRKKPGLMRQHLTSVLAAARICGGEVVGAEIGASEFTFIPSRISPGSYHFDIGTAGSTSLVLQTLIPPLLRCESASRVTIIGGTHVPVSPPYHYLDKVFLPALKRLGLEVELRLIRPGFYPRGGGEIVAEIHPAKNIAPFALPERPTIQSIEIESAVSSLPLSIAERQRDSALNLIRAEVGDKIDIATTATEVHAFSPGTFIFIHARSNGLSCGFSSIGERGKPAEKVGAEAAQEFIAHYRSGMQIDPHLVDQLPIYLAQASGPSTFSTSCITRHLLTNLEVIRQFRRVDYHADGDEGASGVVTMKP